MADAQGRFNAKDELLYVSDSEPTAADDPNDYTLVGLLTDNPFAGTAEEIVASDKEASGFTSSFAGSRSYTVDLEANRKNTGDAGQVLVETAFRDGTNLFWLITTGESGDEYRAGAASVTAFSTSSANDEIASMSATLSGQGTYTIDNLS